MNEWWSNANGAWIGAIGGSAFGLMGGLVGCLAWALTSKGRGKRLVLGLIVGNFCLGLALLTAGFIALIVRQPYHVWYPLLLGGAIATVVYGANAPAIYQRYKRAEAQKLEAEELRRS